MWILFPVTNIIDFDALLQIFGEFDVLVEQISGFVILELPDGLVQGFLRQVGIDPLQRLNEPFLVQRAVIIPLHLRPIEITAQPKSS